MSADDPIDNAAQDVADGKAIDWAALHGRVRDDEARERLKCLQVVEQIAGVHRGDDTVLWPPSTHASERGAAAAPAGTEQGEAWGQYRLLEAVGSGSFGCVYRAWDPDLERVIAIKILYADVADEAVKRRVLDEGRALARVKDANVVTVYGVESHDSRVGLCMDFVQGETLEDVLLTRGAFNAREATLVGQDVCRALAAVHGAGFVHRDVKARNVMRERAGRILLMDFGAGRELAELEGGRGRGALAGTPLYMAPEVLAGEPASRCSDVYSVGVLLYHLVTGKYPVEGKTLGEIRTAHMFGKRTPISDLRSNLPASFIRVVDRALAANPELRWQSAGELLGALVEADVDAVHERASILRRVSRGAAALAAVLAGIIACGILSTMVFNHWLGRADFANEGIADWLRWGLRATLAPAVLIMFEMIALTVLLVCWRFLRGTVAGAQQLERRSAAAMQRWKLDQLDNLSSLALLLSIATLALASWYFFPLLNVLTSSTDITAVPEAQLAMLSPAFQALHESYREAFTSVAFVNVVVWYPVFRLAATRRERLNRAVVAGGAIIALLTVAMLDFPYRVVSKGNDVFEVARWQGARCYALGERGADVLLFCPRLSPRNRVVSGAAGGIERLGVWESPFTQFQPNEVQPGL